MLSPVDIMAFGAHPDDVECGAGGLILKEIQMGYRVGLVDLTRGELATNGTPEERAREADQAAAVMGLSWRENLGLPDGCIDVNEKSLALVIRLLRKVRPKLVLAPFYEDRHPDHEHASQLVTQACFFAGLRKMHPDLAPHRPSAVIYYFLSKAAEPTFLVDVTSVYQQKKQAVLSHQSQFGSVHVHTTYLNSGPGKFTDLVESRDRYFGSLAGVMFAEGFAVAAPLLVSDPMELWSRRL